MNHGHGHNHGPEGYRHEALFYADDAEFIAGTMPFIRDAVDADEAVLVAVDEAKIGLIQAELNGESERIGFTDIQDFGRNPARIIPLWRDFVERHASDGGQVRGIGEPIWPERSRAELAECELHEALLNLAFADSERFWLLCPYDRSTLDSEVIEAAERSHPEIAERGTNRHSHAYEPETARRQFEDALPEPSREPAELTFSGEQLSGVRGFVSGMGAGVGLEGQRLTDLVLAVDELAANSIRHGGGRGSLRVWDEDNCLQCEVRDAGRIDELLIGRRRPIPEQLHGRGLWVVNQVCDLVQIRSSDAGNVVRLHMRLP